MTDQAQPAGPHGSDAMASVRHRLVGLQRAEFARASRLQSRIRHMQFIVAGLGFELSRGEWLDLETSFTVSAAAGKALEDKTYYAATAAPGVSRLADMLEESAFWSAHLMKHSATQT